MKTIIISSVLLFLSLVGPSKLSLSTPVYAQSSFDSYDPNIPWIRQIGSLDNFGIYLRKNPEMIGYIGFYVGEKDSVKKMRAKMNRVKRYLVEELKINKNRLVIVYAGELQGAWTVLQPSPMDKPPPKFGVNSKN